MFDLLNTEENNWCRIDILHHLSLAAAACAERKGDSYGVQAVTV